MTGVVHPSDEQLWLDEPAARVHLEGCASCWEARDRARRRQQAVTDVLAGATPVATAMPETVQRRLADTLAQETLGDAAHLDPPAPTRRTRRTSVWASIAAAAAVLVLVATVVGVQQTGDPLAGGSSGSDTLAESSPAQQAPSDAARSGTAESDTGPAPPPIPTRLLAAAQLGDAAADRIETTCGAGVLDDPGDAVVAVQEVTTDPRGGVLVTVDGADGQVLWWLPSCTAGADAAFGRSTLP